MFWSSSKIDTKQKQHSLVTPFDPEAIKQGAYELCLGPQAAVSCDGMNRPTNLGSRGVLCIPGGQFGLLLTEELISIPNDAIAFISLKTKIKSQGLVNVSGFHVDPGFKGRLKFWVYNAGNQDIQILRGDRTFLIWFSDLDSATTDPYPNRDPASQNEVSAEDLRRLQGRLASPAALAKQIEQLEQKIKAFEWIGGTALLVLIGLCMALAAPLLDNLVKPTIDRFSHGYPPTISASPTGSPTKTPQSSTGSATATSSPAGVLPGSAVGPANQPAPQQSTPKK
jgi:dCTP deaminase